jgi:hypothetical protein
LTTALPEDDGPDDMLPDIRAIHDELWGKYRANRTLKQTYLALERGDIPAGKIAGKWVGSRTAIREHRAKILRGETTPAAPPPRKPRIKRRTAQKRRSTSAPSGPNPPLAAAPNDS